MAGAAELQLMAGLVRTVPAESRALAVSCPAAPIGRVRVVGVRVSALNGTMVRTVMLADDSSPGSWR